MGRPFEKKSFKSNTGRGGSRLGAGRPRGGRNKITQELKEMLAPLDQIGITRLERIIRRGNDKQALEAIRLAWEFRHGRPKAQVDYAEEEGSLMDPNNVIVIGGNEAEYIAGMRRARGEDNPS